MLKTQKEKASYGIGVDIANNLKRQGMELDIDLVIRGIKDKYVNNKILISEEDLRKTLDNYRTEQSVKRRQLVRMAMQDDKKKREGEIFLDMNKTKEGVVVLPNGLQYKVLRMGEGKKPVDSDTVEFHYIGTLIDGKEFGDSRQAGKPITTKITGALPGWTEVFKLMPVGSRWQLFVPAYLAYEHVKGPDGRKVGPGATVIFEVELLAIK